MQSIDLEVLHTARTWRLAGHRIWLVTVAETFGASPRPPGSLLVIRDDGLLAGSVSGGCIEDDLVARREDYAGHRPEFVSYGVSSEEARRFGLPCGGTLDVLVETDVPLQAIEALLARIEGGEVVSRGVSLDSGEWTLTPALPTQACTRSGSLFCCIHGPRWRMLVVGASEIARYLADLAAPLDFQVSVCDPREEYRASWRVPGTTFVEGMPDEAVLAFRPDAHSVILTVSHDPKLDDMALIEALGTDAFYVGAVGSLRTTAERRARLAEHFGLTAPQLARLRGPAGLPIGSRTPPEIAVAILADLVAARNGFRLQRQAEAATEVPQA